MTTRRPGLARGGHRRNMALRAVIERDGDRCGRCHEVVELSRSGLDPEGPTLGHVIPAAAGGTDTLANLELEHRRCNLAAGARPTPPAALIATPIEAD